MREKHYYIFGKNAITEALVSEQSVEKVYLSYGTPNEFTRKIFSLAKKAGVPCVTLDKGKFRHLEREHCPLGTKTQGIVALINETEFFDIKQMIGFAFSSNKNPILIALDEITDPHNLGAIARTAECAGIEGIILPVRNSSAISPVAVKVSAGALEHIKTAKVNNLTQALIECKEQGFWVIGTDSEGENNYTDSLYDRPVVLVIGSEGKGMRPAILKQCDYVVKIPLHGKVGSLNASVSSGVLLFEIMRQKNEKM